MLPERTDWQPRRPGETGERGQIDALLPERHASVRHDLGFDPGLLKGFLKHGGPGGDLGGRIECLAEHDAVVCSRLLDDPRGRDRRRDVGGSAEHV